MPRGTQVPPVSFSVSNTGLSPALVRLSSRLLLPTPESHTAALQPRAVETARFGLFPFRSPLLWESRLISFPLGTEMFHFPRSAPPALCIHAGAPGLLLAGCPIQTFPDRWMLSSSPRLFAAYHVFPRLQRQGIRLLLLLTCFSASLPCSIVKEPARLPRLRNESRFEISILLLENEASCRNSVQRNMQCGGPG